MIEGYDPNQRGLTQRQRPGFVEDDNLHGLRAFQRRRVTDQDAAAGGHAGADHDRGRRCESQRAGAGDHQHRHRIQNRHRGGRPGDDPCRQRHHRDDQHHGDEHRADPVRQTLNRRFRGLGVLHQPHDAGQQGLGANRRGFDDQVTVGIDGAGRDGIADRVIDRQAFARQHGCIDRAAALTDAAIDGDAFAGAHDDHVAAADGRDREVDFHPVTPDAGGVGAHAHQRGDRCHRAAPRPGFQPFAGQYERDQQGGGLEIKPVRLAGAGPHPGGQAPGGRGAEGHEQVHVAGQRPRGVPAGLVKPGAEPELHDRGQRELNPPRQHESRDHHAGQQRDGQDRGCHQVQPVAPVL